MNEVNSIIDIKEYGKIKIKLSKLMDEKGITRNKMRSLTGVKYEVVDRYYKADNVERVDLDFLAKACYVLNCKVGDLLEYEKKSQYQFVASSMTVYQAWHLFQSSPTKLDALLLTESGRQEDRVEAIITYDDLLKYIYTHDQYVFN